MSGENDDIVVTGSRYDPILEEWRARPQTIDEEGLGGGGLGSGGGGNAITQPARISARID